MWDKNKYAKNFFGINFREQKKMECFARRNFVKLRENANILFHKSETFTSVYGTEISPRNILPVLGSLKKTRNTYKSFYHGVHHNWHTSANVFVTVGLELILQRCFIGKSLRSHAIVVTVLLWSPEIYYFNNKYKNIVMQRKCFDLAGGNSWMMVSLKTNPASPALSYKRLTLRSKLLQFSKFCWRGRREREEKDATCVNWF